MNRNQSSANGKESGVSENAMPHASSGYFAF
jgi:hypothetical protein